MNRRARRARRTRVLAVALAVLAATFAVTAQVREFKPVTDAMLASPDPADWLHWRRTLDGWAHSPLKQIDKGNVRQLQLVWSSALGAGINQPTPLVYAGVMYVPQAAGVVHALDAATGDLVWEYTKKFAASPDYSLGSRMRSIAIYGDKIYVSTPDAHIVALDARTGKVAWDHTVADYKLGYRYTSGPIVVKGRVIAGMTGCERYKNDVCFISAHDARTGTEVWRTTTIARPGEAGGDTWGDLPLQLRAGGDAWLPGSYDQKANLVYWSVAQAKPWARISRGTDGDALYTNSTLAIEPETGKIVWHHQFIPGETHDLDEVFESVLIDRAGRSSLFKMGKLGILWEIDRTTGRFYAAHDLGYQNVVNLDPASGNVTYRPGMIPRAGVEIEYCPDVQGIRNWRATAYHPETRALYIPIHPRCQKAVFTEVVEKENSGSVRWYGNAAYAGYQGRGTTAHPASTEHGGYLIAMEIESGKLLWRHPMRTRPTAATLTTAGGLAINADSERYLYVHDVTSGRVLFQTRLPAIVQGFPVTYAVNGRQYLAVPTGAAGEGGAASGINAIYVFALPAPAR